MATNIFGGGPNAVIAKVDAQFSAIPMNATNTAIIYLVTPTALKSWVPDRSLNAITGIVTGQGYYFVAKQDIDLNAFFFPPIVLVSTLSFSVQPTSATISSGGTNTFSATVVNAVGAVHYQWTKEGADIAGATESTYTTGVAGVYRVVVSDENNIITSNAAVLTLAQSQLAAPNIVASNPTSGGFRLTINPAVAHATGYEVQASINADYSGSTNTTITALLTDVIGFPASTLVYWRVRALDSTGNYGTSSWTTGSTTTGVAAFAISSQPTGSTVNVGSPFTLSVTVVNGTAPFTYTLKKNGTTYGSPLNTSVRNIATTDSLSSASVDTYYFIITDSTGASLTSNTVTVTVNAVVSNVTGYWLQSDAPITLESQILVGTPIVFAHNADVTVPFTADGDHPKYLQFFEPVGETEKTHVYVNSLNEFDIAPDNYYEDSTIIGAFRGYIPVYASSFAPDSPIFKKTA